MGDVWLKTEGSARYYDHRVHVEELSNWKRIPLPNAESSQLEGGWMPEFKIELDPPSRLAETPFSL